MNFYPFHIGDYASATAHLSILEDGVYRRLLDVYYTREAPIPADPRQACRLVRAQSKDERRAVEDVLREFFTETPDGWRHDRCDIEIARANEKKAKAAQSAAARWGNAKPMRTHSDADANASEDIMRTHSEGNAPNPNPNPNPKENLEPSVLAPAADRGVPPCPIEQIVADYHATLPALPRILVRNDKRDALIRGRWREAFARGKAKDRDDGLALFREFFAHVGESKFLTGRSDARNGSAPFVADLEWLMRPTNFAKVVEGRYHRG